jgi:hypothetical protein
MNEKKLELIDPPINGYMMYGYHLSITLQHKETFPWFYSNFIELFGNMNSFKENQAPIHFNNGGLNANPFLNKCLKSSRKEFISGEESIVEFVKKNLQLNFYFITNVDEYYLSNLQMGGNGHLNHQVLVYGFDDGKQIFHIVGYKQDGHYGETFSTYKEFEFGFMNESSVPSSPIRLLKMDHEVNYNFNLTKVIEQLNNYLIGTKPQQFLSPLVFELPGDEVMYGINVYDYLVLSIEHSILDIRGYHTLMEHKSCMLSRLKYLQNIYNISLDNIVIEYENIHRDTRVLKNLVLKYQLLLAENKYQSPGRIVSLINKIKTDERTLLNRLVDLLMNQCEETRREHIRMKKAD